MIARSAKDFVNRSREAFIRQVHLPGEECEFDWGEVKLTIGREQKRLNKCFRCNLLCRYLFKYAFSIDFTNLSESEIQPNDFSIVNSDAT